MEGADFMPAHLKTKAPKVAGHLEEKRGIYQMALSWSQPNGERARKSISTGLPVRGNKKRAEGMLKEACKAQEAFLASIPDCSELLFADFMEQWLEVIRPDVRLTTFGGYQLNVGAAISPWFRERGILLSDLTADDINDFYSAKLKYLKATSVIKYHANIGKAIKYAVEKGLLEHSIMDKVKRPKEERYFGKFLKQAEAIDLFEAVKGHKLELGVILGAFYGLRRGEIVGLKWDAIDFEANTISIEYSVTTATIDGKKILVEGPSLKSKSSFRTLPLVPGFRKKLLEILEEQKHYQKLCGKGYNKQGVSFIYTDQLGNRVNPQYLSKEFPKFLDKNGLRRIRFHDLRHSAASLLLASGVSLKQIQEWLGHSNFSITADVYAHLDYNSKVVTANSMTWFNKTTLGQVAGEEQQAQIQNAVDLPRLPAPSELIDGHQEAVV